MVEHQYKKATAIIQRVNSYIEKLRGMEIAADSNNALRAYTDTLAAKIQTRSDNLAQILCASLSKLPNSQVKSSFINLLLSKPNYRIIFFVLLLRSYGV
jgi:hypothetical protein